jgi:hypothetical protein
MLGPSIRMDTLIIRRTAGAINKSILECTLCDIPVWQMPTKSALRAARVSADQLHGSKEKYPNSQKPKSDSKTLLASIGTLSAERQGTLTLPSRASLVVLTYILNFPKPTLREPFSGRAWSYRGNSAASLPVVQAARSLAVRAVPVVDKSKRIIRVKSKMAQWRMRSYQHESTTISSQ